MVVYAFIDGQNLHRGVEEQGWRIDFHRFRRFLTEKYQVTRAFYFLGYRSQFRALYDRLTRAGFELVFAPTLERGNATKGNVDVLLTLHSVDALPRYEGAVLVTSDGDFVVLVAYLKTKGKLQRILAPTRSKCSKLLRRYANELSFLEQYRHRIEFLVGHE